MIHHQMGPGELLSQHAQPSKKLVHDAVVEYRGLDYHCGSVGARLPLLSAERLLVGSKTERFEML